MEPTEAADEANRIAQDQVMEMAGARRWTLWIALFTGVTAVAMVTS